MDRDIKKRSPFYTKLAFFISFVVFILAFVFVPKLEPRVSKPRVERDVTRIELPEQMKQLKEPPPPAKPKMPVEAESEEEVEQATIERTDFTGFEKIPPKPRTVIPEFVPYDTPPKEKFISRPRYPDIAKKAGIEGTVYLRIAIDSTGTVVDVRVVKGVHELLDKAAKEAALQWKYYPAKQRDMPVGVWIGQPVTFRLTEE